MIFPSAYKDYEFTEVFQWNWDAINEPCPKGCNSDRTCTWCHGSNRKYRYIINEGSSRSGKTFGLIDLCDIYSRQNKNKRTTVWRETKINCKRTLLEDLLKHHRENNFYKNGYQFNKTESILSYTYGSSFEVHGADEEDKVHGLNQDVAWLNEPYGISRDVFDQIDQRTSDFILLDWNPKMNHFIDDLKLNQRTIVLKSGYWNNPFAPIEQVNKIKSYLPVSMTKVVRDEKLQTYQAVEYNLETNPDSFLDEELEQLALAQYNEETKTADAFKWSVYGLGIKSERPNRIFKWNEISKHEYDKIDVEIYNGVDWGKVDPWGILEAKYYDGGLYLHELNYLSENEWMERLNHQEIMNVRDNEEGLVYYLFNKMGISRENVIICDNNRPTKIIALRKSGWEYALEALKPKGSIIDGIDILSKLQVYYTSESTNIAMEQELYSRKVDRYGIVLEVPEDSNNHLIDPTRYIAMHLQKEGIINVI